MSWVEWSSTAITPSALDAILRRHKLMPPWVSPEVLAAVAGTTTYGCIYNSEDTAAGCLAILLFRFNPDPGVGQVDFIPTIKNPKDRMVRRTLSLASAELRDAWFDGLGLRRVECRVSLRRTRWISGIKAMGFRCETRDSGMRDAADFGMGPEPLGLFSLVRGDMPPPIDFLVSRDDTESETEDAASGTRELNPEDQLQETA